MTSRPRSLLGAFALAGLAATSVVGDEPPLYKLEYPAVRWKADDLSTLSGRRGAEIVYSPKFGAEDERSKRHEYDAWIASVQASAVDRDGVITHGTAWFESGLLLAQGDKEADQTLGALRMTFESGRWKEAGGTAKPSAAAKRWVTDRFVKACPRETRLDWLKALEPSQPVAVGATWKPDLDALARHLSATWDMQLDGKGATGTCKLESLDTMELGDEQQVSSLWVELEFPVRQAPKDGRGERHSVNKDTRMAVTLQCRAGHGVPLPYREITCSGRYDQRDTKGEGRWKVALHAWWGVKHEGWIPDAVK